MVRPTVHPRQDMPTAAEQDTKVCSRSVTKSWTSEVPLNDKMYSLALSSRNSVT